MNDRIDIENRKPGFSNLIWHFQETLEKEPSEAAVLELRAGQILEGARRVGARVPEKEPEQGRMLRPLWSLDYTKYNRNL